MERRDFIKMCSAAGLGVVSLSLGLHSPKNAQAEGSYTGPLWLLIHAGGGWDPTSLCDPKGKEVNPDSPINNYSTGEIGQAGNLRYAPVAGHQAFFEKYQNQLIVVNGVDTSTNSHDSGTRYVWSGSLIEGRPSFGAVVAGTSAPGNPMAYITNGGYDSTAGIVSVTRVGSINALQRLAYPNRLEADNMDSPIYHTSDTAQRIAKYRAERAKTLMEQQNLPRIKNSIGTLYTARTGAGELQKLTQYLPDKLEDDSLKRQAQVAIAAYRAGLTVSANMTIGGFDTHGQHDNNHFPRLQQLLEGVDFAMEEAKRQQVADRINIVIGSDFGRTPHYNSGQGKDHWAVTSMMFLMAGIAGNKVIGATDDKFKSLKVNPSSLAVDDSGVRITPAHVHKALQKLAGVNLDTDELRRFGIAAEDLPLFG
jgi:hypothetical protein